MVNKPSMYPLWAQQDIVDPVSGQNNVLVPPPEKQQYGWDRLQFPPRNWFNWLGRETSNWIQWFDQQESQAVVADGSGSTPLLDPTTGGLFTINVVDTGANSNFYSGIAYFPPASGSPVTINQIAASTLTVSQISTSGTVTVSGGTGPYIVWGQTKTIA